MARPRPPDLVWQKVHIADSGVTNPLVLSVILRQRRSVTLTMQVRATEVRMRPSGEEEYQRFMGFPASLWPWAHRPEGARAAGRRKFPRVLHPIAWFRWRL